MRSFRIWVTVVTLLSGSSLFAQNTDTLRITLAQADSLLISRNLSLIAYHYEVDKAEARKVQEKLFSNPELFTEWNLYNPTAKQWLDAGRNGQKIIQLQKVFRIAGQRKTSIRLAEEEKQMTQWQYFELARSLKYALHVSYYRYHFLNNAISNIRSRLALLKSVIDLYGDQYTKGNVSLQELTRLKSTYFDINNQVNDTQTELVQLQSDLQLLLVDDRVIFPIPNVSSQIVPELTAITLPTLIEQSLANRPELKIAQSLQAQNQLRYSLERKQAIPNLTTGAIYDQAGSYVNNYTGIQVGLQVPLFNRNQGRIQEARIGIEQSKIMLQSKQQEITREVQTAWNVFQLLRDQYASAGTDFEIQLDQLSKGLVSNYSKNNISLLEFTDMFESYNTSIIQLNQLKADLNKSYEELNYAVGQDLRP
ncbi:MAG TPA: TolC family protein [Ohtaekwangia sp.]|uniref:TolC family protein n=1 Tax=Ohtaekwangia sp. TaxID=2066019 RepID=UPI002F93006B